MPERREAAEAGDAYLGTERFRAYRKTVLTYMARSEEAFEVETIEGVMTGKPGDYVAIGIHGEMYPVDRAVVEDSYEGVPSASALVPPMLPTTVEAIAAVLGRTPAEVMAMPYDDAMHVYEALTATRGEHG